MIKYSSSVADLWNLFDDREVFVSIIMLRQVVEVLRSFQVLGDINAWVFVQPNVMVADCPNDWEHVSEFGKRSLQLPEVPIPGIIARVHVIIVSVVSSYKE